MVAVRRDVRLVEEFEGTDFSSYTCDQSTTDGQKMGRTPGNVYAFGLNTQRHVDVRTFAAPQPAQLTNYVTNPSFEYDTVGSGAAGWSTTVPSGWLVAGATAQVVSTQHQVGNQALQITTPGGPNWGYGVAIALPGTFLQGVAYTVSFWIKGAAGGEPVQAEVGVPGGTTGSTGGLGITTSWQREWFYWIPSSASTGVYLGFANTVAGAITFYLDGLSVVEGNYTSNPNGPPYFDGDASGYQWSGLKGNSISVPGTSIPPGPVTVAEHWTMSPSDPSTGSFSTGPLGSSYNRWPALQATLPATATYTFTSVTAKTVNLNQLGTNANVALTLPAFPLFSITLSGASVAFSSDGGNTWASATFATSTNTIGNGNTYVMWPLSAFSSPTVDLTKINAVRITIPSTNGSTVTLAALRVLDPNWTAKDADFDDWNGCLRQCIPLDGNPAELPVPNQQALPTLWFANSTPGIDDPRPVNATFATVFYTGSQAALDSFSLQLRGINGTDQTQLDASQIQIQLSGAPQPGLAQSVLIGRTVGDLDISSVSALDSESMQNMDAVNASINQSWLQFQVAWGTSPSVVITRSTAPTIDYQWTGAALAFTDGTHAFQNGTYYLALASVTDTTARLQLYTLNQITFAINSLLFDTGVIADSYRFIRRGGRVGWKATIQDDSQVRSIRPEQLVFAEFRSAPLNSITPVQGVRVYADSGPKLQLWQSWSSVAGTGNVTPTVSIDNRRSTSGTGSTRVDITQPTTPGQGLISNVLSPPDDTISGVVNWPFTEIDFDLWFPSAALNTGAGIALYLLSQDGNNVPLITPRIVPDAWQSIRAYIPANLQSGRYQLGLTYAGSVATTFWVDSVNVLERTVAWSARANAGDYWVDLRDELNSDSEGAMFTSRGTQLQVRAQAFRQDASIVTAPKIVPVYAQLGALVWPEQAVADSVIPGYATLSSTLNTGSPITSLPASGFTAFPPVGMVVTTTSGANTQSWTVTGIGYSFPTHVPNAILVASQTPNFAYPSGTVIAPAPTSLYTISGTTHGSPTTFSAYTGTIPANALINWFWAFGDGSSANGSQVQHTYAAPGTYNVTLTTEDYLGVRTYYETSVGIT